MGNQLAASDYISAADCCFMFRFCSAGDQMANQKNRKTIDCGYHKAVAVTYILGYIISSIDMVTDKCPSFVTIQVIYLQNRGYRVKTAITLEEALPDGSGLFFFWLERRKK